MKLRRAAAINKNLLLKYQRASERERETKLLKRHIFCAATSSSGKFIELQNFHFQAFNPCVQQIFFAPLPPLLNYIIRLCSLLKNTPVTNLSWQVQLQQTTLFTKQKNNPRRSTDIFFSHEGYGDHSPLCGLACCEKCEGEKIMSNQISASSFCAHFYSSFLLQKLLLCFVEC